MPPHLRARLTLTRRRSYRSSAREPAEPAELAELAEADEADEYERVLAESSMVFSGEGAVEWIRREVGWGGVRRGGDGQAAETRARPLIYTGHRVSGEL